MFAVRTELSLSSDLSSHGAAKQRTPLSSTLTKTPSTVPLLLPACHASVAVKRPRLPYSP